MSLHHSTVNRETTCRFTTGITTLLQNKQHWLENRRVGLVSHPAAVDSKGRSSTELLRSVCHERLVALFGPEHGFWGTAAAGQNVRSQKHPLWRIPVYSLYGKHRKPTAAMLENLDTIVFDLQDIGARPYTCVGTLRYVLEAAARHGKAVIVADRPVPLPSVIDGPVPEPKFESFVASIQSPVVYGMTPAETAVWLKTILGLNVSLNVAKMRNYWRQTSRGPGWPPWIPPSPGIASWESACCYTTTVFCEALPAIDNGRGTGLPFQLFGAPWINSRAVTECLCSLG